MNINLSNIFLVFKIYKDIKKNFLIILFLSILIIIFDVVGIFLLAYLVALVLNFDLSSSILNYFNNFFSDYSNTHVITLILIIFISKFIINILTYKKIFNFIKKEQKQIGNKFAEKILNLRLNEKENIKIFTAFTEFLRLSSEYYLVYFLKFISEFLILVSIILLLFYIDFKLNLILIFGISTFLFIFFNFGKKKIKTLGKLVLQNYEKFLKKAKFLIYSIKEIKAFKRDKNFKEDVLKYFNNYSDFRFKQIFFSFTPRLYAELFFVTILLIITFYINLQSKFDNNDLTKVTLFTLVLIRAIPLTSACIFSLTNIWNFSYANRIIFNHLKNFKSIKKDKSNLIKEIDLKNIEVNNLSFSFNKKKLFKNLNFKIKKNEIFGLFGKSGSGKTTLGLILMGLIKPKNGEILYKSYSNKKNFNPKNLDIFSYIPQEINLMEDSIFENIKFNFKNKQDNKKIKNLLKSFNLFDEIDFNSNKNNSNRISGGQKQRILICRAIYNQKKVIILDEPSSNLDKKNIDNLINQLKTIKKNVFIIMISHDKELKKICDNFIDLKN